ncbi:MAG: SURF1 family protein [Alcanivorax sp.]|nr:SURF1 family protein [Alcanivorax sp.]
MQPRQRRSSLVALLATVAVAALCIRLGVWQLHRADQKSQWLAAQATREARPPAWLHTLLALPADQRQHRAISVRGRFDNHHNILLDNRILNGVAGYHLFTPLHTGDGHWVLVNRGWLPWGNSRQTLPDITPVPGTISLTGTVYQPSSRTLVLKDVPLPDNQWPLRVEKVDFAAIGEKLGVELAPLEIRVAPKQALGGVSPLPRHWRDVPIMGPDRHRAYALQWFLMALVAVIFFIVATHRNARKDA